MTTSTQPHTSPSERGLWFGVLGGPLAWLTQLAVNYPLVPLICGTEWGIILHLVSLLLALITVAAGVVAWQNWQLVGAGDDPVQSRQRFMARFGVFASALFLVTIFAQWLPVLFLHPCDYGP